MLQYAAPAFHGVLIWWSSTALILFLDRLPPRTFRWSIAGASVILVLALAGVIQSAGDTSVSGAYVAFTSAVLVWGWLEITFYMGYVTGPRTHGCAAGCRGWRHFGHAIQASLYHEIAILLAALVVLAATWGQPNQFGAATFVTLWWMHQSARLNVLLGVSNLNAELLPDHLDHLKSFFTSKPMNLLFPFSITLSTIAAVILVQRVTAHAADPFQATGYSLVATMMGLAILEHWFLVLPVPAARLWNGLWQWKPVAPSAPGEAPRPVRPTLRRAATLGGRP